MTTAHQTPQQTDRSQHQAPTPSSPISPAEAVAALNQVSHDRDDAVDRLMAPKWWYLVNGVLAGTTCLVWSFMSVQALSLPRPQFFLRWGSAMVAFVALIYVVTVLNDWRKQQIGSDYSTFMGGLRPRNAIMWAVMIGQSIVLTAVVVFILWAALSNPTLIPDPLFLSVVIGVVIAVWDYGYDRYLVHTVKRGR